MREREMHKWRKKLCCFCSKKWERGENEGKSGIGFLPAIQLPFRLTNKKSISHSPHTNSRGVEKQNQWKSIILSKNNNNIVCNIKVRSSINSHYILPNSLLPILSKFFIPPNPNTIKIFIFCYQCHRTPIAKKKHSQSILFLF